MSLVRSLTSEKLKCEKDVHLRIREIQYMTVAFYPETTEHPVI